ncbi:hypothetical protein LLG90_25120 [Aromatoleum toluclasticum]|uniref:hypothetical protein n=1 Tax=Aromatoleum toluclasticum TaxID=92003 RepID=UPI001D18DD80|nr:hypothetical protein [Aromatoleum toluclasticum]MCC4118645.1 hypothetical protein [Aromatoleum toluclasticum]
MDPFVRRALLKPLEKRKAVSAEREAVDAALNLLDARAIAGAYLPELAKRHKAAREQRSSDSWKNVDSARNTIALALGMFVARGISAQEYAFMVAIAAEGVHDGRISDDAYPEVVKIMAKIRSVEVAQGLGPDDFWAVGEGPCEFERLNQELEAATERRFVETLRELGVDDLADLYVADRQEFDRRRERGRRAFFHKDEVVPSLMDVVMRYESEAKRAASAGAYTAAVTLLGAAVEGLLILRCLRSPTKAKRIAASLPREKRPRALDGPTKWKFDTLIETCLAAGWLPQIPTSITTILPGGLAHSLRQMRNYVHPGKVAEERPWIEVDQVEYTSAEAIFTTISSIVADAKRLKLLREAAQRPPAV